MKKAIEEIKELLNKPIQWEIKEAIKINILANHIDNIEKMLRYIVDQKVKQKYGK